MQEYQQEFITFLIQAGALTFGDFVTKSGRKTPYFINTGRFDTGARIGRLGEFYARHMMTSSLADIDIVFGPAYKGIPLAVSAASALAREHQRDVGFAFNRKEAKDHGDKGIIVGAPLREGARVVIVEDVITAGTTLSEVVPWLRNLAPISLRGVVIAVDRCEKGSGELSAVKETEQKLQLPVYPLVTVYDIISYLEGGGASAGLADRRCPDKIREYLSRYGAAQE